MMKGTLIPKIKICCISSIAEAEMAIANGATAIGLVSKMPSGPGVIKDEMIVKISNSIPSSIESFLLTSETKASDIIAQHQRFKTTTIQIVDKLEEDNYEKLRERLPGINIVQVIHVINEESIKEAISVTNFVDTILLDSGNPKLATKVLGGTGKVHNWKISKMIREEVNIPTYLAGGLNSNNIKEAIKMVQPYGVDLCSGVRTNGKLDPQKLTDYFSAIKELQEP